MKILKVKIDKQEGTWINFISEEPIKIGTKLLLQVSEEHYFEVMSVSTHGKRLYVKAKEIGYWSNRFDNKSSLDIRTLIGLDLEIITDKEKLSQIREQTMWC